MAAADAAGLGVPQFDLSGPLPAGVTVLEASAGTGKTYTIAALASRFIAEGAARLDELLLVTFTRVATSELRERVRERLVVTEAELGRLVNGAPASQADPVVALLAAAPIEQVRARRERLAEALANFDAITIETTHGFCQSVLDGLGTLAESDPRVTFADDLDELLREVVDDLYIRRFHGHHDGPQISRTEAWQVARAAIASPLAVLHPLTPPDASLAAIRRRLALAVRAELEARKRALALMTYDDQLTRLLATLTGARGAQAVRSLRDRFRVVLIDEFQDTDPIQWAIVDRAFGGGQTVLVLIGDPKQAIYAFRGADVYAYLEAARTAGRRATLAVNRRSDQPLLDGLDALFGRARLGHPDIVYRSVRAPAANLSSRLHGAPDGRALRIRLLDGSDPSVTRTKTGFPNAESARSQIAADLAADVVAMLESGAGLERRDGEGSTVTLEPLGPGDLAVLVRTHRQARLIQAAVEQAGVPAVISGSGSVFATPAAADWLAVLAAVEQPAHPARARAAALTSLLGFDAAALAQAQEPQLEALHQRLHAWARMLREHGFPALARAVLSGPDTTARLLEVAGGERLLTDLDHVAQLLGAAAGAGQPGITALTAWLRQRIATADSEGSSDERSRRLDSDADAVQVLTFHRSKGLEFPIVYCPFLWEARSLEDIGQPVHFHDHDGQRAIDVGPSGAEYRAHLRQHHVEERGEELRLAYVALTRARHQAVVWWASSWHARDSPLGRLLFAQDADGTVRWEGQQRPREDDALARFDAVAAAAPHAVSIAPARPGLHAAWARSAADGIALDRARFERTLDSAWRRTSYSALTAAAHESLVTSEAEDPGVTDEPATAAQALPSELPLSAMAAGPELGTLIHEVLRALDFASADLTASAAQLLADATAHRPGLLGCSPEQAAAGLALALATPLGGELGEISLAGVPRADRLDELAFELPLAGGEAPTATAALADVATALDRLLEPGDPLAAYAASLRDPALAGGLRGYLTGSIDLVLRVRPAGPRARYVVVDYKTNWLAPAGEPLAASHYAQAALALEMQRSHYALQALLYSVALHRYLRWRLPGYDPGRDLGGTRYLFLRGMLGPGAAEPGSGVFAWHPPGALVAAVSDLLAGGAR